MTPAYTYRVTRVVKVIDGDTVRADVELGFHMTAQMDFRLAGLDAPELSDKVKGQESQSFLAGALLTASALTVQSSKGDKYGRWLGTFFVDGVNINAKMLELGLARVYNGGAR